MASKVKVNAQQFTARWQRGMEGAAQRIEEGVNAVTEAPGKKAAAQKSLWLSQVAKSGDKWAKNVQVPLSEWQAAMIQKGIPALANSIPLAIPKVEAAASKLIPALDALLQTIPPRGASLEANIARVTHIAKGLRSAFVV